MRIIKRQKNKSKPSRVDEARHLSCARNILARLFRSTSCRPGPTSCRPVVLADFSISSEANRTSVVLILAKQPRELQLGLQQQITTMLLLIFFTSWLLAAPRLLGGSSSFTIPSVEAAVASGTTGLFVPPEQLLTTAPDNYPVGTWGTCGHPNPDPCHHSLPLARLEGDTSAQKPEGGNTVCYHWNLDSWAVQFRDRKPRHITGFTVFKRDNTDNHGYPIEGASIYLNDSPTAESTKTPSSVSVSGTFVPINKSVWKIKLVAAYAMQLCGFWLYESLPDSSELSATRYGAGITYVDPASLTASVTGDNHIGQGPTGSRRNPIDTRAVGDTTPRDIYDTPKFCWYGGSSSDGWTVEFSDARQRHVAGFVISNRDGTIGSNWADVKLYLDGATAPNHHDTFPTDVGVWGTWVPVNKRAYKLQILGRRTICGFWLYVAQIAFEVASGPLGTGIRPVGQPLDIAGFVSGLQAGSYPGIFPGNDEGQCNAPTWVVSNPGYGQTDQQQKTGLTAKIEGIDGLTGPHPYIQRWFQGASPKAFTRIDMFMNNECWAQNFGAEDFTSCTSSFQRNGVPLQVGVTNDLCTPSGGCTNVNVCNDFSYSCANNCGSGAIPGGMYQYNTNSGTHPAHYPGDGTKIPKWWKRIRADCAGKEGRSFVIWRPPASGKASRLGGFVVDFEQPTEVSSWSSSSWASNSWRMNFGASVALSGLVLHVRPAPDPDPDPDTVDDTSYANVGTMAIGLGTASDQQLVLHPGDTLASLSAVTASGRAAGYSVAIQFKPALHVESGNYLVIWQVNNHNALCAVTPYAWWLRHRAHTQIAPNLLTAAQSSTQSDYASQLPTLPLTYVSGESKYGLAGQVLS
ncbi:unnamed protein product [Amoebophrya sp. A120]|nr:unnamed protein product [Amoebophrya sp. A120]|eukprot:GSA120T00017986001.1